MATVTMKELLEAGVHFGHQVRRWNPKMKEYIFGERNGIYIIDLQKTQKLFRDALNYVTETLTERPRMKVLFVGTKRQAQDAIKEEAERAGQFYVKCCDARYERHDRYKKTKLKHESKRKIREADDAIKGQSDHLSKRIFCLSRKSARAHVADTSLTKTNPPEHPSYVATPFAH